MHSEKIYARIEEGKIVQYPVTIAMINERANPLDTYYQCYFPGEGDHPNPTLYQKIVQTPTLIGSAVYIDEKLVNRTVDEMFALLFEMAGSVTESGELQLNTALITSDLIDAFETIVKIVVQKMLDDFALTRGYDDIKSACDYVNSKIPEYKAEAIRCIDLRDDVWHSLTTYINAVKAGTEPPPMAWSDIAVHIPPITWGDV